MDRQKMSALALAVATCFPGSSFAMEGALPQENEKQLPALGSGLAPAALIAAALAGVALAAGAGGSGGGNGASGGGAAAPSGAGDVPSAPVRTLAYTSPADFQTAEFAAQQGLQVVRADRLYYNGHYSWYLGNVPDPTAGTGSGVRIAVADTGINAREGASGGAIAIDAAASYDYVNAKSGSAADDSGHGTHVAGIIAAPKNGSGMHGLAYNATVVNFKIGDSEGIIRANDAQLADMVQRAGNAGAMIINNSWATASPVTSWSTEDLKGWMPRQIDAFRAFVARGGVVVFAAGNEAGLQPSVQAGLPQRISGIQPGWLAVVAIDGSGAIASYSNRCGVAAAWCLAAPGGDPGGGLYSMYNNGDYAGMYGTSMAAPHAAGALGALKSMFPNLSYLQIRDRLLYTANRGGAYADAATYGQGLMNLEAASSPVGGVSVPTGTSANGTTVALAGSGIEFQSGALRALGMQGLVLVVDNYQRAPFWMPAHAFFREAAPRMIERHWATLRTESRGIEKTGPVFSFSHAPGLNSVVSADLATYRLGFSQGTGGEAILGSHLELAWLPRLAAPGTDSVALGYASDWRGLRIGLLGTVPAAQATSERTLEASSLGSRSALGLIAQHREGGTTYGASLAFADDFERPIGIATGGAFAIGDSGAVSSGFFVQQSVGARTVLEGSMELARHRAEASLALTTPAYAVRTATLGTRTSLGPNTTVSATMKREWTGNAAARLHVPLTIDENGTIGRVTYALPYDELVGRTSLALRFDHRLTKRADLRAGITREHYGFGVTVTGIAAVLEIAN